MEDSASKRSVRKHTSMYSLSMQQQQQQQQPTRTSSIESPSLTSSSNNSTLVSSTSSPSVAASRASLSDNTSAANAAIRKKIVDITNGLVPPSATDAYLDRFKGWTDLVRRLIAHFECIVEQERKLAEIYNKSAKDLSAPIRVAGAEVFDAGESIQGVLKSLFDAQSKLSSEHLATANHIETETLPDLRSLLAEIRKKSIDGDKEWVQLDKGLQKDRETYAKLAGNLKQSIKRQVRIRGGASNVELGIEKDVPRDPYIANL
ncbi:hypothetical protein HDU97_008676, partial [Phlyctochytrium planicorne]